MSQQQAMVTEIVVFECKRCGGTLSYGEDAEGTPLVLHSSPPCSWFMGPPEPDHFSAICENHAARLVFEAHLKCSMNDLTELAKKAKLANKAKN